MGSSSIFHFLEREIYFSWQQEGKKSNFNILLGIKIHIEGIAQCENVLLAKSKM